MEKMGRVAFLMDFENGFHRIFWWIKWEERKKGVRENFPVWGLTTWKDAAANSDARES